MQQNEQEFIRILRARLEGTLPKDELEDLIADYTEHFSIGKANGRTDEELWQSLGSPEEIAREIKATHLVKKAEHARSAENIWHAVMATLGLGLFNLAVVLIPFILLIVFFVIIFIVGLAMLVSGPLLLVVAFLQLAGVPVAITWWKSPVMGILASVGLTILGVVLVMIDFHIMRACYWLAIRYLKWNIRVIRGDGEGNDAPEEAGSAKTTISREGTTALDLRLNQVAGEIDISGGSDTSTLLDMTAGDGLAPPHYDYSSTMNHARRTVRIRSCHPFARSWYGDQCADTWNLKLNREVPVSLDIRNRAGRIRLALGDLNLSSLSIRNATGETQIDLGGYNGGNFSADIKNGVGSLVLRMPRDCNLEVRILHRMGGIDVRGFVVEGDTYRIRTDRAGAPQISCRIRQGIGSIRMEAV